MRKSFTVIVTGGAPFKTWDYNTSAMVRNKILDQIHRKDKLPIYVLKYPHDVECNYKDVIALMPELWSGKRSVFEPNSSSDKKICIDLIIHMGMNPADDDNYVIEKRARRDGYRQPGEDGKPLPSDAFKGQPDELFVGFDVDAIITRTAKSLPDGISAKASNDAGFYVCEL